jgi:hypothetical protein
MDDQMHTCTCTITPWERLENPRQPCPVHRPLYRVTLVHAETGEQSVIEIRATHQTEARNRANRACFGTYWHVSQIES